MQPETNEKNAPNMTEEADVGAGNQQPGQAETQEMIEEIQPLPESATIKVPGATPNAPADGGNASK